MIYYDMKLGLQRRFTSISVFSLLHFYSWELSMSVLISDTILNASQLTSSEFRQEIALYFFQSGRLTIGYASQLAEMSTNEFRQLLKNRQIPLYSYDVEDFELDLKNLQELGRL